MKKAGFTKKGILLWAAVFMAFWAAVVIIYRKAAADRSGTLSENRLVELFVLAPCESCHEEDKFRQVVLNQLAKAGYENPDCIVYNVYRDSGAAHFDKTVKKYQLELTLTDLPAAVVNGTIYRGTYQEIAEAAARHLEAGAESGQPHSASGSGDIGMASEPDIVNSDLLNSPFYRELCEIEESDTALVLFVTGSCESCQTAESYLRNGISDVKYHLLIYNILENNNAIVLRRLMQLYDVPENEQQVPLLFTRENYLSGAEAILGSTAEILADGAATGSWEEIISHFTEGTGTMGISKLQLAATGFINGLNPCGISMLLMILSLLLMSDRNFYGGSFIFLTGKFLTYLFLGFTIGTLLSVVESTVFQALQKGMKLAFAVLALSFGYFYLMDFIHVLKREYGKEKLRLPESFRKWNHTVIRKLLEIPKRFWYPALFLLGIVISAGEFLCTGQVYLASLIYMVKQNKGFSMQLTGNLVLYLTAMCVPMVLVVVLVSKGKSVMSASHLSLKILPAVKLAYSIFFVAMFFSLLF